MFLHDEDTGSETDSGEDIKESDTQTFERLVLSNKLVDVQLFALYDMILRACKQASNVIENGCIYQSAKNECFPKIDVNRLLEELQEAILAAIYASNIIGYAFPSHSRTPIKVRDGLGPYCISYNAMTSPSNLAVNLPAGTLFAIWSNPCYKSKTCELQYEEINGRSVVGAGYVVYGTRVELVMAFEHGTGVYTFLLDKGLGAFVQRYEGRFELPKRGLAYCVNEGYTIGWNEATKKMVNKMKDPRLARPRTSFSIGSLVPDFHRIFKYGGFYLYPASKVEPNGGLLLLQECWPLAYICNESGGFATQGQVGVLGLVPTSAWEKSPFYAGSISDCLDLIDINFILAANLLTNSKSGEAAKRACPVCHEEAKRKLRIPMCTNCQLILRRSCRYTGLGVTD